MVLALGGTASAQHRRHRPPTGSTGEGTATTQGTTPQGPVADVPITVPHEQLGNLVARAQADFENLELAHALALLRPLHEVSDLQPAVAIDAALLETAILGAQHADAAAVEACARAVIAAGYDPDVAVERQQSPRVQTSCARAAEQVRHELIERRHLRISGAAVVPGDVAWAPVVLQASFAGDLSGFDVGADVRINGGAPITVNLPAAGGASRAAALDANLAAPGARLDAVFYIRDSHGVLLRGDPPSVATVPEAEAAVRFSRGSDEGPLSIDHRANGQRVRIGETLPLPVGPHLLEVRTRAGIVSRANVLLRRGQVASVALHSSESVNPVDVLKWTTTIGAIVALGAGGVFQYLTAVDIAQLEFLGGPANHDMNTGRPVVSYTGAPMSLQATANTEQTIADGLFIGGGVLAGVAIVTWIVARPAEETAAGAHRPVAFGVSPGRRGAELAVHF